MDAERMSRKAERVEAEVTRDVTGAELEIVLCHSRLHPGAERAESFGHHDEE